MFILVRDRLRNAITFRRFTRRRYYSEGKINSSQEKSNRWNLNSKELLEGMSTNHFKTSSEDTFLQSIQFYRDNHDNLWKTLAITRKRSRLNFRIHKFKRHSIDRFLQSLKPRDEVTRQYIHRRHIMLYGAGTFGSGGKGERSVPLKYIKKHCRYYFVTHEVNEFRTSQICPDCERCRLHDVEKSTHGEMPTKIRGLKWCPYNECRQNPLKNRDEVGAKNIMKRGLGDMNPLFDKDIHPWKKTSPTLHMLNPKY
jgi:hypothetical protein